MSRRYAPKKNYNSRPGYRSCGRMVYGDAKKALAVAKGVRRLLNVEIKNFDVVATNTAMTQFPQIIQLSNIPRGDTTNERDGAQCKMVGFDLNYTIVVSATLPRTVCRVLLVLDKQTNQAVYIPGDLLDESGTAGLNIVSSRNLNNKHRFQILYDRTHSLSLDKSVIVVRKYIKKEILLRYDNSTSAIADLTQNSLSVMHMTNETTNVPNLTSFFRLRFIDN